MKPTLTTENTMKIILFTILIFTAGMANAQSINDVRWKSASQVRQILGEPISISQPKGTHATYTMWRYPGYTVAFSNNKAFHLFQNDSLRQFELRENR